MFAYVHDGTMVACIRAWPKENFKGHGKHINCMITVEKK